MQYILSQGSGAEEVAATAGTVISTTVVLGALVLKSIDLAKYLAARLRGNAEEKKTGSNGLWTLLLTAAAGVGAVFWLKATSWADEIKIGNELLRDLSVGSTALFGVAVSTIASTIYDFKKAIDDKQSSETPKLTIRK